MEIILANLDLILIALIVLIAAVIFARQGQIDLLRELILSLTGGVDAEELYAKLPKVTKLLISDRTLNKIVEGCSVSDSE